MHSRFAQKLISFREKSRRVFLNLSVFVRKAVKAPGRPTVFLLSAAILAGLFFLLQPARAQITSEGIAQGIGYFASNMFLSLGKFCISLSIFALKFFIALAQYNDYIDAAPVAVGWIMVRDVANMFFVVALLMIAFGTILGMEQYQWNKTLVKLILAAVFINFSNLVCGLMIDLAHVFTITFVNAIAGTAGGNLIHMFKLEEIFKIVTGGAQAGPNTQMQWDILIGSFAAFIFSVIVAVIMAVYCIIMLGRVVVLWVLIILSPLAFILQVIPQTESYAKQWWDHFGKYVLVAPVMVFFLWLSFATLGAGDAVSVLNINLGESDLSEVLAMQKTNQAAGETAGEQSLSLSAVTTWQNMSSFLIPLVLLVIGTKVVQQFGVFGGEFLSKAVDFGKKVATIASGYAAGRWLAGKGWQGAKKGIGAAAYHAPLVGGKKWENLGKTVWANVKTGYYRKGAGITKETIEQEKEIAAKKLALNESDLERRKLTKGTTERDKADAKYKEKGKEVEEEEKKLEEMRQSKRGVIGWIAQKGLASEKHLKKSEGQAEVMEKIAFKRVGAEAGGWIFNRRSAQVDAQDRVERGILEAEDMRSKAKDKEFMAQGERGTLASPRAKWGGTGKKGLIMSQSSHPESMAYLIEEHKRRADTVKNLTKAFQEGVAMKIDIEAEEKVEQAISKQQALREELMSPKELDLREKLEDAERERVARIAEIEAGQNPEIERLKKLINDPNTTYNKPVVELEGKLEAEMKKIDREERMNSDQERQRREALDAEQGKIKKEAESALNDSESEIIGKQNEIKLLKEEMEKSVDKDEIEKIWEQIQQKGKELDESVKKRDTEQEDFVGKMSEIDERKSMTGEEERIWTELQKAKSDREVEISYVKDKEIVTVLEQIRDEDIAKTEEEIVKPKEEKLKKYMSGEERKQWEQSDEYKNKQREVTAKIATEEGKLSTQLGIGGVMAVQRAALMEDSAKAAKIHLEAGVLGLHGMNELFGQLLLQEEFAKAGEKLKEKIKQIHLAEIFKRGANELEEAGKKTAKGMKDAFIGLSAAAMAVKADVENEYLAETATTERTRAKDIADSQYSKEYLGFDTPYSAFKSLIKKRMDSTFQGVEREQAVVMALGSLTKLLHAKESGKGEELDLQQKAQMMANIQYLTKQAWSDDLLGRIVNLVNSRKNLTGEDRKLADSLSHVFVDRLKWGKQGADGQIEINHSSGSRTNDLHRLAAYAGDVDVLQSENAVLKTMRGDKNLGYVEAAGELTKKIQDALGSKKVGDVQDADWQAMAHRFGIFGETGVEELKSFARKFVKAEKSAADAMEEFRGTIESFGEANELLTDFKNYAIANAHIDDGGHAYYDMKDKIARGMLYDDAENFVLSDWRKIDGRTRVKRLKTHSVARMDENHSTASYFDPVALVATFENAISKLHLSDMDVRTQSQLVKLAADEVARRTNDKEARFIVGDMESKIVQDTYGGNLTAGLKDIARDWAVMLQTKPEVLMALLGNKSGVSYEQAMQGKLNLKMGDGTKIDNVDQLVKWIDKVRGKKKDYDRDSRSIFKEEFREFKELNDFAVTVIKQSLKAASRVVDVRKKEGTNDNQSGTYDESDEEAETDEFSRGT